MICWSKGSDKFTCIFHHCPLAPTLLSTTLLTDHKKITRAMGNYSLSSLIWTTLRCKQPKPDCLNTFPCWKQCECSMAQHDVCPLQIMILLRLLFVLPWNNLMFNSSLIVQSGFFFLHHDKSFRRTNLTPYIKPTLCIDDKRPKRKGLK